MDATLKQRTQELASELATQSSTIEDLNAAMRELMKSALEKMLNTEMAVHLESTQNAPQEALSQDGSAAKPSGKNRRNGTSPKTIQGDMGKLPLDIPRDRQGTFDPQLIPKHQRRLAGFDEKILALYAKGMTTRDIQDIVKELYGVDVSATCSSFAWMA